VPSSIRRRRALPLWLVLLALLGLYATYALIHALTHPAPAEPPQLRHSAISEQVQVFFTTPTRNYPDAPDRHAPPPMLRELIGDLSRARASVDVAVFDLDLPSLVEALIAAKQRGVKVRVVIDSENLADPAVAMLTGRMQDRRIPVVFDRRAPFMHNKFVVIDSAIVWTGSWNLTENCTFRNNNNAIRIESHRIAAVYRHEFEQMHMGRFGSAKRSDSERLAAQATNSSITIYFSPQDKALPIILDHMEQARSTIVFMAFSLTSAPVTDALIDAVERDVRVSGVVEKRNARGAGSVFSHLRERGVDILEDGNCDNMHHKVMIIDDKIVITGSYNFSDNAENTNDENLAIIHDATIARFFLYEYARVRQKALEPARCN
jgi:phosphatidylserine/phosphatidylglycerophosphate/cardiolipin synthase-like enzyme